MTTDAQRLRKQEYYIKNRDVLLAKRKIYFEANKEKIVAYKAAYCRANLARNAAAQRKFRELNPLRSLLTIARKRARKNGLDFDISVDDIELPSVCPLLGVEVKHMHENRANRPSIDRIDNTKGYIKGNVVVVSLRANIIKSDATASELRTIASNLEKLLK